MSPETLFPQFEAFVREARLDRAGGSLSAKLPRILGQGTTKATGMKDPPAPIERKAELAGLEFPADPAPPEAVREEVRAAAEEVARVRAELKRPDGLRRFVAECFQGLDVEKGQSNGYYFAGRLLLCESKGGLEWAWSVTPHYPIIDRIPPDPEYVVKAHQLAQEKIRTLVVKPEEFEQRLTLAWHMARRLARSDDDVLVTDVMKMYQVAGQDDKFWQNPKRVYYKDLPEAAFVVNILSWRSTATSSATPFAFVPATLSQASGKGAKVFFMPLNAAGSEVRPMIYLRRK